MSSLTLYVNDNSVFHSLSARAILALATAVSVTAYVFNSPSFVGGILATAVFTLVLAGGGSNLRRAAPILVALTIMGFLLWPAFVPSHGPTFLAIREFELSLFEVRYALGRSLRIATFLVVGLFVVTTTSEEELVHGLRKMGVPFAICFSIVTALRLVPDILNSVQTVKEAQATRGFDTASKNPVRRIRNYIPLLIPAFLTAFRRIETQAIALESRGFSPSSNRSYYNPQPFRWIDRFAVMIAVVVIFGSIYLSYQGIGQI